MDRDKEANQGAAAWAKLRPRVNSRSELIALLGTEPRRFPGAVCVACDTRVGEELCTPDSKPGQVMELRHWAEYEYGLLRPSELKLLLA